MAMKIYTGLLKELGPSVTSATDRLSSTEYAYIELMDGQVLRKVSVVGGLDGKLDAALSAQGEVELHIMEGGKVADLLVAVRTDDGKIYATDLGSGALLGKLMVISTVMLGIFLLPIFGIGLIFFWLAWRSWHGQKLVSLARKHVSTLSNAIWV
jgi:hypothetical protein